MKQLFYNYFKLEPEKIIVFFGGSLKSGLTHLLAKETVTAGKHVLIMSPKPSTYPIEGKVLICDEATLFMNLIRDEEPTITYLASRVADDMLIPFKLQDIFNLIKDLGDDTKLFLNINTDDKHFLKKIPFFSESLFICNINFNLLRDEFSGLSENDLIKDDTPLLKIILARMQAVIKKNCPSYRSLKSNRGKICFIGQVKSLFDENVIIPLARDLKDQVASRILYGNVNNYQIKEI